jgi:hypothetical protein
MIENIEFRIVKRCADLGMDNAQVQYRVLRRAGPTHRDDHPSGSLNWSPWALVPVITDDALLIRG